MGVDGWGTEWISCHIHEVFIPQSRIFDEG